MARPPHERTIECLPRAALFKPAGIPARDLEQIALTVDEVEALRLTDFLGLSQDEAAARLGVSRQTVGRVVESARRKVADVLVNGKALVIAGGAYHIARTCCCAACGHRWQAAGGNDAAPSEALLKCPACGSAAVTLCPPPSCGRRCEGGRRRQGHNGTRKCRQLEENHGNLDRP